MGQVFILIGWVAVIICAIALINGRLTIGKFFTLNSRTEAAGALTAAVLFLVFWINQRETIDCESNESSSKLRKETSTTSYSLGLTPTEFIRIWNNKAKQFGFQGVDISSIKVDDGELQNSFSYSLDQYIAVSGAVNKTDGTIRFITVFGQPVDEIRAINILTAWTLLVLSTNRNLSDKEREKLFREFGLADRGSKWTTTKRSITRGNVTYTINPMITMILFSAKDRDDPY